MGTRNARRCVQDTWKGVRGARRKLNRDSRLDVRASYSENPIEHSQREDRHARQHLGLTLTTTHPRTRERSTPVRDNTWG
jgi:hypothetical protein